MMEQALKDKLVDALMQVPSTEEQSGRSALMTGIPPHIRGGLARQSSQYVDLVNMIDQLEKLGRLDNGERPLIILARNGLRQTRTSDVGRELQTIAEALERAYSDEKPSTDVPETPELLVYGGKDERVSLFFIKQALLAASRVARLRVPRHLGGAAVDGNAGLGTGWVAAPQLLFTNYHVIAARDENEPAASDEDFRVQAENTVAWFDYHQEGEGRPDVHVSELVASNRGLDYALLRLEASDSLKARGVMAIVRDQPDLQPSDRLNIVQHPGGGPLQYAIRNNFYISRGEYFHQIRYLTDTTHGSSGSPVLNDRWEVVAIHHAYRKVSQEVIKGEVVKYHNQGIAIHDILQDLPAAARQEIANAQGGM